MAPLLRKRGFFNPLVIEIWRSAVPASAKAQTIPLAIRTVGTARSRILTVYAPPGVATEVYYQKRQIIARLNQRLGRGYIADLRLVSNLDLGGRSG